MFTCSNIVLDYFYYVIVYSLGLLGELYMWVMSIFLIYRVCYQYVLVHIYTLVSE